MLSFDFSPLYRSSVGFDRLADLFDSALTTDQTAYPPYNIEVTGEHGYQITMAVAGFTERDISIIQQGDELVVSGRTAKDANEEPQFLYRGIPHGGFERRFQLADYVKVQGARLTDGLLTISLVRELPEALRPRKIEISRGPLSRLLNKAA